MLRPSLLSLLALLAACNAGEGRGTADGGSDAAVAADSGAPDAGGPCSPSDPRTEPPEPFIGYFGLRDRLVAAFDGATESLDVATYIFDDPALISAVERAHERGVAVRVLLDGMRSENTPTLARLQMIGATVKTSPSSFSHYHAKIAVIDRASAIVMSANLNDYSMETERNHGVVLRDPRDVADVLAVFEEDFGGPRADLSCSRLVISPVNSRSGIEGLIAGAESELRLQELELTDDDVRGLITARAAAGVRVRVILADPAWIDSNTEAAQALRDGGAEVRFLSRPDNHAKLIVADDTAFVGSENLSWTSLERNREIGILSDDPTTTAPLVDAFESDWAAAGP